MEKALPYILDISLTRIHISVVCDILKVTELFEAETRVIMTAWTRHLKVGSRMWHRGHPVWCHLDEPSEIRVPSLLHSLPLLLLQTLPMKGAAMGRHRWGENFERDRHQTNFTPSKLWRPLQVVKMVLILKQSSRSRSSLEGSIIPFKQECKMDHCLFYLGAKGPTNHHSPPHQEDFG